VTSGKLYLNLTRVEVSTARYTTEVYKKNSVVVIQFALHLVCMTHIPCHLVVSQAE
jgi:hypothetical protein